jgi:hypothetical protein
MPSSICAIAKLDSNADNLIWFWDPTQRSFAQMALFIINLADVNDINPLNFWAVLVNIGPEICIFDMWGNDQNEIMFVYFQP